MCLPLLRASGFDSQTKPLEEQGKTKRTSNSIDDIESNLERPGVLDENCRRRHQLSSTLTNLSASGGGGSSSIGENGGAGDVSDVGGFQGSGTQEAQAPLDGRMYPADWTTTTKAQKQQYWQRRRK